MKFPEEARLTPEAKDLICKLLCDVDHRLGTQGADQIKVIYENIKIVVSHFPLHCVFHILTMSIIRPILGSKILVGTNSMKWKQHLNRTLRESLILKIL